MSITKSISRKITVAEMAPHIHSFSAGENKVNKLTEWLSCWIRNSLKSGKIKPYDLLPAKGDLAFHIGVSQGTMQNVFRLVEDMGLIDSKQKIGSYIRGSAVQSGAEKLTSKRELAIDVVKKYITENHYKVGDVLTSARKLSVITGMTDTTIRLAITNMFHAGILEKHGNKFFIKSLDYKPENIQTKTLVEKVAEEIKVYVNNEFKKGDKLPSNTELTKKFNVSIKTIHDAIKLLSKEGFLYTRRGKYGTIVYGGESEQYCYEKIEQKIRHYIAKNSQVGDKLPTIKQFAEMYEISEKTIKKALDNLAGDGYLTFVRGRYGGTFVMDIPNTSGESYKWLAINADYVQN